MAKTRKKTRRKKATRKRAMTVAELEQKFNTNSEILVKRIADVQQALGRYKSAEADVIREWCEFELQKIHKEFTQSISLLADRDDRHWKAHKALEARVCALEESQSESPIIHSTSTYHQCTINGVDTC